MVFLIVQEGIMPSMSSSGGTTRRSLGDEGGDFQKASLSRHQKKTSSRTMGIHNDANLPGDPSRFNMPRPGLCETLDGVALLELHIYGQDHGSLIRVSAI